MRHFSIYLLTSLLAAATALCGCADDRDFAPMSADEQSHTSTLRLTCEIQRYDDATDATVTRATTDQWPDGAVLYFYFTQSSDDNTVIATGKATYKKNGNEWTITHGTLPTVEEGYCEVVYVEGQSKSDGYNYLSAIYLDANAVFSYDGTTVSITTLLMPQLGRIRFRGTPGKRITLSGLYWYYNHYINSSDNKLYYSYDTGDITLTVASDGYTPYIYVRFEDDITLKLTDSEGNVFTRTPPSDKMLADGKSGYMDIPTVASHRGWFHQQNNYTWQLLGTGQFTSEFWDPDTWEITVYKAAEGNIYRIPDLIVEGYDLQFELNAAGTALAQGIGGFETGYDHPDYGMVYARQDLTEDVMITGNTISIPIIYYVNQGHWPTRREVITLPTSASSPAEAVDLGLSVKWANMNVGASVPEEYGDYFAWGETTPKTTYDWDTYKWYQGSDMTKYCTNSNYGTIDNKTTLEAADDAATANWGGTWRMPTVAELDELPTKCFWTWTTQNGVNGYRVTGPNGNSIFLPAAGYRGDSSLYNVGSYGFYWSSSLLDSESRNACDLLFNSGYRDWDNNSRDYGFSVRPVTE